MVQKLSALRGHMLAGVGCRPVSVKETLRAAAAPPVLDLAATTAALVALAHAAARAPGLRQLKITVMPANARGGQGVVRDQHASALLARVMAALRATLAANGMLRCAQGDPC